MIILVLRDLNDKNPCTKPNETPFLELKNNIRVNSYFGLIYTWFSIIYLSKSTLFTSLEKVWKESVVKKHYIFLSDSCRETWMIHF